MCKNVNRLGSAVLRQIFEADDAGCATEKQYIRKDDGHNAKMAIFFSMKQQKMSIFGVDLRVIDLAFLFDLIVKVHRINVCVRRDRP